MNDTTPSTIRWSTSTMRLVTADADLATAALRYATRGIPVFPCVPGGKQPLTPNGFHDASASAATVDAWWRRFPDANIGLPTGATSGVLIVDVDVHRGGSGFPAFERARSAGLTDGWAWLVRTPSGGLHAYYPPDGEAGQRCWQVPAAHIDFRGDGGYVIVPPSQLQIEGRPTGYVVIAVAQHRPQALDAQRLRQFLEPPRPLPPPTRMPTPGTLPDKLAAWVASRPEGARNHGLFWAACRMVEDGHQLDTTISVLLDAARSAGLPDREADTTIRSAYRNAAPPPRTNGPGRSVAVEGVAL